MDTTLEVAFDPLPNSVPKATSGSPLYAAVTSYLDADPLTNRMVLHADQAFYDETWAALSRVQAIKIYFNERVYDLLIGLPFEHVSCGEFDFTKQSLQLFLIALQKFCML